MLIALSGCSHEENSSSNANSETNLSEVNENNFEDYKFGEIIIQVADEWITEESENILTVTCEEDYSYMIVMVYDAGNFSKGSQIYDSCASSESFQDISPLKEYDYPLYSFNFTENSTGNPIEAYYFVKDQVCYFIVVPQKTNDKDSIIYENIDDILLPVKRWILSCATLQSYVDDYDIGFLYD